MLSDHDLHLLGEGHCHRAHEVMGAHGVTETEAGVRFVIWAPHARCVSVVGDGNGWDGARRGMERVGSIRVTLPPLAAVLLKRR